MASTREDRLPKRLIGGFFPRPLAVGIFVPCCGCSLSARTPSLTHCQACGNSDWSKYFTLKKGLERLVIHFCHLFWPTTAHRSKCLRPNFKSSQAARMREPELPLAPVP